MIAVQIAIHTVMCNVTITISCVLCRLCKCSSHGTCNNWAWVSLSGCGYNKCWTL